MFRDIVAAWHCNHKGRDFKYSQEYSCKLVTSVTYTLPQNKFKKVYGKFSLDLYLGV
jgi:hypothetical protein